MPEPIDWPRIMRELSDAGYSRRVIQALHGVHRDRCQKIAHGARPYYDEGILLLELVSVAHLRQGSEVDSPPPTQEVQPCKTFSQA